MFKVLSCARLVHLLELFYKVSTNASKPDPSQPQIAHLSGTIHLPWVFEPSHLFSLLLSHPVYVHWLSQVILLLIQSLCVAALFTFSKVSSGFTTILFFHYSTASNFPASSDILHGLCTMVIIIIFVQTTQ